MHKINHEQQSGQKTVVDHSLRELRRHGSEDFPIGIYRDDFSQFEHGQIPWHWHEEIQFDYVLNGRILVQVGSRAFILREGEGIFINTGLLHRIVPVDDQGEEQLHPEEGTAVIYSCVGSWRLVESDRLSKVYRECIMPLLGAKTDGIMLSDRGAALIPEMAQLYGKQGAGYTLAVKARLCLLWQELLEQGSSQRRRITPQEERDAVRVKEGLTYLQTHFGEQIRLEELAAKLAISKSELCRCFKRVLKISPIEYLIQYRVEEAQRLLRTTQLSITEIALQTGFDSASHLGRFFFRHCGCSPRAYRSAAGNPRVDAE